MTEVLAFRLVKTKWLDSAFDGLGPKRYGGRWNSKGKSCVYAASTASLAILEVMVHINDYRLLADYSLLRVRIPLSRVVELASSDLPDNWRESPPPSETAEIGDQWLRESSGLSVALAVPSAVLPHERIFLLNPGHREFQSVVDSAEHIKFNPDARLFSG